MITLFLIFFDITFSESHSPPLLFEMIGIYYNTLQDYIVSFDKDYFRYKFFSFLEKVMQKFNFE